MGFGEWVGSVLDDLENRWDKLDYQTRDLLIKTVSTLLGLYISYLIQLKIIKSISNPKSASNRLTAIKILRKEIHIFI